LDSGNDDLFDPSYAAPDPVRRPSLTRDLTISGLVVFASILIAIGFSIWPSLGVQSSALVLLAGGTVTITALRRPLVGESERRRPAQWLPWLVLAIAFALWELALLLLGNNDSWPPLSLLAAPIDTLGVGRFTLALLWLAGGAWLVRRTRR
jgi:hypothetical protein